jgi:hypothetical protein
MRYRSWFAVAAAALVTASVAVGAVPKKVTVTGQVQAVSPASIRVAGTSCVFAPTNSRMMMPAIIRDIGVGDTATLSCVRASGRLVVASIVERPASAVVVRGAISATDSSITVRGVTCTFSVSGSPNPRIMAPTTIRGQGLMACLRANGQLALTAAAELTPQTGRVVLISGNVSSVTASAITVSGVTCQIVTSGRKPLPGMPTIIRGVDPGDSVFLACAAIGGHLVATSVSGGR